MSAAPLLLRRLLDQAGGAAETGYLLVIEGEGLEDLPKSMPTAKGDYRVHRVSTELGLRHLLWQAKGAPLIAVLPEELAQRIQKSPDLLRRARNQRVHALSVNDVLEVVLGVRVVGAELPYMQELALENVGKLQQAMEVLLHGMRIRYFAQVKAFECINRLVKNDHDAAVLREVFAAAVKSRANSEVWNERDLPRLLADVVMPFIVQHLESGGDTELADQLKAARQVCSSLPPVKVRIDSADREHAAGRERGAPDLVAVLGREADGIHSPAPAADTVDTELLELPRGRRRRGERERGPAVQSRDMPGDQRCGLGQTVLLGVGDDVGLVHRDRGDPQRLRGRESLPAEDERGCQVHDVGAELPQQRTEARGAREHDAHLGVRRQRHRAKEFGAGAVQVGGDVSGLGGDHERLVTGLRQVAEDVQNGTGDPVHVREEGLGQQRDSHASRVGPAARLRSRSGPDVRDVHRMLRGGSPLGRHPVSIRDGE